MKRKVVNAGKLRLSPNEEAFVLKEDYERRRKLRLLQVRAQERGIALQIREDIKQRRNQEFTRLAEELRTEWEESQTQKIKNLEKLYLASLRTMGEGHQQAKENEPDLNALAQRAAERKRKAEMRHKEALKVQKNRKETLMKQKTWHIKARKEALLVEKERSAKITSLPPPPPTLFENIEVKRITNVETSSSTYHHLYSFVNREMGTKQPDPHLAAEEEAKRLEELQKQAVQQRMQQSEKAHMRGFQAMKKIHLAQNQEKLMKELKQLQQEDLARRRQTVARMPPQLLAPLYRRSEMKEDWQRELEFAFEDMYNADRKVKGNLILHLEPEPLPTVTDQIQDKELDVSMEQENLEETENIPVTEAKMICSSEAHVPLAMKTHQVPSKILFKKLLNKIRSQKSLWTIKSTSEDESEMITTISETESKTQTVESGATASEDRTLSSEQEQVVESDMLTTVDSGPLTSEPHSCDADSEKKQEINETQSLTTVAQSSVLLHPQEAAARIRMAARQRQIMEIEEQKQKQLELLEQIEQQKLRLETDCFRAQLEEEKKKETRQTGVGTAPASCTASSDKDDHRKMIRDYQHQLLQQNSDLKALQQQLDTQRKAMGLRQEAQEEVLLQKLSKLEKRVSSEQVSSSSPLSQVPLPVADSERIPKAFPTGSNGTVPSSHPEVPRSQDGCLCSSQPVLPQRDHLTTQLAIQREAVHSAEKAQEELLLDKHSELIESKSDHAVSFLSFLPKETERAFIPLSFAEVKSANTCELYSSKNEHTGPSSDSAIPRFQGTLLNFSQPVLAQQDNVGLQKQLDLQKEVLRYSQKVQEKLLVQRQTELQQHIRKHQETMKDFFKGSQTNKPTVENDFTQKHREWPPHLQHLVRDDQENISPAGRSNSDGDPLLSGDSSAKHSGEHLDKELGRRSSKPPVAKVKCGLDLNQHELSAIQEVESPASGKISLLGKPDFYEDRDPLRVSVSREQSFLGSPLACDPFGHVHPLAQENISGSDSEAAVKVKEVVIENHAGLSYAVEEEQHTYPDATVEPDNVETQEIYHEPLSSVTVSTGSLSYENTDVSLTNPDDLDFPELEDTFPNLHGHLFKPLEPHPDFDTSSSSGIQDSRAFYQSPDSSCENHCAPMLSKSTASFTSLQTSLSSLYTGLTQPLDPHFADAIALSFATENFEASEQSFQQLLPEFSSQESQHTDLPSIFSIEARDPFQGMENHNHSEQIEILQNKKIAHFQLSIGNLQSSVFSSSDEADVFHPVNLQYSTPCGSASSEISIKDQLEGKKRLGFEELTESGIDALHQGFNEDYKNESCGISNINPHAEEIDSQLCVRTVECSQNENSEDSAKAETPKITGNLSQLAQSEVFLNSGSLSLQSHIPVWETESGHGIMEEPELTLVSASDVSIAETDFANLTLEEKGQYEPSNCIQVSEFLPLASETEISDCPGVPEHSMEKTVSAETLPKPTAIPESLQEAFVKRKKKFIERSSQRQEEIKKKTRISEKSPIKIVKEKLCIGSPVSCLKVMNKVRVPLPEDRQTAQAFTQHRALRVYNESVEKQQKEENAKKHDVGAQSRASGKEFRKVSRTSSFMCKLHTI
ncbi:centrosomal protein of 295 kDa isoform X9 [Manis javanica]|uniref:centrosomal protein of 295 kDa isoform X9 n=1 Tax=Manis javanica TaxID=9974 RepID=UPI003C6D12CF